MKMKYFGFFVLIVGALLVYLSKNITKKIKKTEEVDEQFNLNCKLLGLATAAIGVMLVFIS